MWLLFRKSTNTLQLPQHIAATSDLLGEAGSCNVFGHITTTSYLLGEAGSCNVFGHITTTSYLLGETGSCNVFGHITTTSDLLGETGSCNVFVDASLSLQLTFAPSSSTTVLPYFLDQRVINVCV